jgi:hypothetical protein
MLAESQQQPGGDLDPGVDLDPLLDVAGHLDRQLLVGRGGDLLDDRRGTRHPALRVAQGVDAAVDERRREQRPGDPADQHG